MYNEETRVLPSSEEERINFLQYVEGFSTMSLLDLTYLSQLLQKQWCGKDHVFFEEGDENNALYFLAKGQVAIFKDEQYVAHLEAPDVFGEVGILHEAPRNATVSTLEECEVYILPGYLLKQIVKTRPSIQLFFSSLTRERS